MSPAAVAAMPTEESGKCHGRECPYVFQCKSLSLDMISGLEARDPEKVYHKKIRTHVYSDWEEYHGRSWKDMSHSNYVVY